MSFSRRGKKRFVRADSMELSQISERNSADPTRAALQPGLAILIRQEMPRGKLDSAPRRGLAAIFEYHTLLPAHSTIGSNHGR